MRRIGLTPDELLLHTWSGDGRPTYAAQLDGLNLLTGETLALVGTGTDDLLERFADALPGVLVIDGGVAARGGALRIHAQQAARVGVAALVITDPFTGVSDEGRALAVADVAGLAGLGLTTVVATADEALAALSADRVCLVRDGQPVVAYPVLAPTPRTPDDVEAVRQRLSDRLHAAALR